MSPVVQFSIRSLLGLPLRRQGTSILLFFAILDGVLDPLDESNVTLFAVGFIVSLQFGQESFESLDLFLAGHNVGLEEQVVVLGDIVRLRVDDAFNLCEEFLGKLSKQVALRDLLETHAQVSVVLQWQLIDGEQEVPELALGLSRWVSCLAELLGLAKQVRLVSFFKLGHGFLFILHGETLAAVDTLDNRVLLLRGDHKAFHRSS